MRGEDSAPKSTLQAARFRGKAVLSLLTSGTEVQDLGFARLGFGLNLGPVFPSMPPFLPSGMGICLR